LGLRPTGNQSPELRTLNPYVEGGVYRNLGLRNKGGYANAHNLLLNRQEQAYLLKLHQKTTKAATVLGPQPEKTEWSGCKTL
jgi:hypothetical protein